MNPTLYKTMASSLALTVLAFSSAPVYAENTMVTTGMSKQQVSAEYQTKGVVTDLFGHLKREILITEDGTKIVTFSEQKQKNGEYYKTIEFKITESGEYYLNGNKLDEEYLHKALPTENKSSVEIDGLYSGGYLAEYNRVSTINGIDYYKISSYSDANFFLDYGSATGYDQAVVSARVDAFKLSTFKGLADDISDAREDIGLKSAALAAELAVAALTVETVIIAAAATGAAAITAYELMVISDRAHEDLAEAHEIVTSY